MPTFNDHIADISLSSRELTTLLEISRVITSSLPIKNMFEVIHVYLSQIMTYKVGTLYVIDEQNFKLRALVGVADESFDIFSERAGVNFLIKKIRATGRPWRSSILLNDQKLMKHPYYLQVMAPHGLFYTVGAPLKDGDQILGSIHLGRVAADGDFTEKEMRILELITNMLAQAIQNMEIKKTGWQLDCEPYFEYTTPVTPRQQARPSKDEEQQLQLLGSVSSLMAKELRSPIANLKMSFYALARNTNPDILGQKELEHMDHSIKKMDKTVGFLVSLSQDARLNLEQLSVNDLLDEVLNIIGPSMDPDIVVVKDYNRLPQLYLDREKMHTVFGNLIENALDAMPGGGRLRITTTENQGRVYVVLEDSGLGIEKRVRDSVFKPFISTKPNGIGLGLTVCQKIVGLHGGKIKLRNNLDRGTEVCVDLPAGNDG